MENLNLTFEQPVARMLFSCAGGDIAPTILPDQQQKDHAQELHNQLAAKLIESIDRQFKSMKEELAAVQPHMLSKVIEFAESFIQLMFECDSELVTEKIVSNLKVAMSEMEPVDGLIVHLHPEMVEMIGSKLRQQAGIEIQIDADPLLELSDCRIDGGGKQQIARLQRHLEVAKHQWLRKNARNDPDH